MNIFAAPLALLLSLVTLLLGGLGLSEATSACGNVCMFGDPVSAGMTGLGLVVAGVFSFIAAANAACSDNSPSSSAIDSREASRVCSSCTACDSGGTPPDTNTGPPR
jgi:hypothetical protein